MAPPLSKSQREQIKAMILRKRPPAEIASAVSCSTRGVYRIKRNLRRFRTTKALSIGVGRPRSIALEIVDSLLVHLQDEPDLDHHEISNQQEGFGTVLVEMLQPYITFGSLVYPILTILPQISGNGGVPTMPVKRLSTSTNIGLNASNLASTLPASTRIFNERQQKRAALLNHMQGTWDLEHPVQEIELHLRP